MKGTTLKKSHCVAATDTPSELFGIIFDFFASVLGFSVTQASIGIRLVAVVEKRLEGMTSAEFGKAERLFRWATRVQMTLALVAVVTIFIQGTTGNVLAGVVALSLYVMWATLDWHYRDSRDQAERGRRALLITDGLGDKISPGELREVEAGFTVSTRAGEAAHNEEFFASPSKAGERRLTELIEESGFYSCRLYRMSARWAWGRFWATLSISAVLFLSSIPLIEVEQIALGARLLCAVAVFLVSQEVLGAGRAYMRAHEALSSLQARVRALRNSGYPRGDLLLLLGDYNSAVESAPLMAPGVYKRAAPELDELWRRHIEGNPKDDGTDG